MSRGFLALDSNGTNVSAVCAAPPTFVFMVSLMILEIGSPAGSMSLSGATPALGGHQRGIVINGD